MKRPRGWGNHGADSGSRRVGLWGGTAADEILLYGDVSAGSLSPSKVHDGSLRVESKDVRGVFPFGMRLLDGI